MKIIQQRINDLKNITNETTRKITENMQSLKEFLEFQGKLYKYSFNETLLIYGQNPKATACAGLKQWNKIGRRVHKGSKSLHVFSDKNKNKIKYLFELENTYGKEFTYTDKYRIQDENKDYLLNSFGTPLYSDDFNVNFKICIETYADNIFEEFIEDFKRSNSSHVFSDESFRRTVRECVGYVLCSRFNIPKGIYDNDEISFKDLSKFNTKELVYILGNITQKISQEAISNINGVIAERIIKDDREKGTNSIGEMRIRGNEVNSGRSYSTGRSRGNGTNSYREVRNYVDGLHGATPFGEDDIPNIGSNISRHSTTSTGRINGYADNIERTIYEEKSATEGEGLLRTTDVRERDDESNRRSNTKRDSIQSEVRDWTEEDARNFTIVSEENPVSLGIKTRLRQNIDSIKCLKLIESENRSATSEEQKILSKYNGFGGIPQVFDSENEKWASEYKELKDLLNDKEYELARGSTLNAHYTSQEIIEAMYKGLEWLGFKGGNILEPSMGVGNFFGNLPENLKDKSNLYGVELDDISGRMAKQLYPKSNIEINGFENANIQDNFFDCAIGNVPFGNYGVYDNKFNKHNFLIHDYFIAKSIDKVKPEGVIAYITSKGTMDKANSSARKYIAERAELLCAVRLPNTAFKESANTETTTDILFLKKRDKLIDATDESWVYTGLYKNDNNEKMEINQYFIDNSHLMLGEMKFVNAMHGKEPTLVPFEDIELKDLLKEVVEFFPKDVINNYEVFEGDLEEDVMLADPNVKNFCYTVINDKIYQRENSIMKPIELSKTAYDRVKSLIDIRDATKNLLDIQLNDCSDYELEQEQNRLNKMYESFNKKYGIINTSYNKRLFGDDAEFPLVSTLEEIEDDKVIKADVFTKRTLLPYKKIESVENSVESLAVCLYEKGKIDIEFMSNLANKTNEEVIEDLNGIIFKNPSNDMLSKKYDLLENWETSNEYLSGNVVEKLDIAKVFAKEDSMYTSNVKALELVQPIPLKAHEINVKIGSSFIEPKYYEDFIREHFNPMKNEVDKIKIHYSEFSNNWHVSKPLKFSEESISIYGTKRMNAYTLMEILLNQGSPKIYDLYDDEKNQRILNKNETFAIKNKAKKLNEAFKKWIFDSPERRDDLVGKYNKIFNSERACQYDGSFLSFNGMSPYIQLREHQKNAVARILFGGNTLLAHCVGAGKTYTIAAAAMEMKRLGISNKPCIVVPNHLVNQWSNEFKKLYPKANILSATNKDFEKDKRKRFCARIATGEWDAVIIGHSSFGKIPISPERQAKKIQRDLKVAREGLACAKANKLDRFQVKQIEQSIKGLEVKLNKLNDSKKDDLINFENLGIDSLFIDEAHMFKNKFMFTKMGNIAGLSKTNSQKSYDMELKCEYINEINKGERGVIFATGTPISTSMVELYTMQSYLQKETLTNKGLNYFDNWASTFGEVISSLELAPSGKGFKLRERFAKFSNLPELMNLYRKVADIQTKEMLNLPVPEIESGKAITIAVDPSPSQEALTNALVQLSEGINSKQIPTEHYNMLCVTNDGRLGAVDMRCVNINKFKELGDLYGIDTNGITNDDYEFSKVNACINKVFEIYKDTENDKLTQMIFCDISTPQTKVKVPNNGEFLEKSKCFSVYDDIKEKLMMKGVNKEEIAFIHDAKTDEEKETLFRKMRNGSLRILLGSTARMGAGTNCQTRLIAEHHLDCPWRPSDYEQRIGRIVRQGNKNEVVQLYNYVTKSTFDAYLWQIIETKQKFISQIMSGKTQSREMEDIDATTLTYAEVKAIATGNPAIKRKMELDLEVQRLKVLEQQHTALKHSMQDKITKEIPLKIVKLESLIQGY